MQPIGFVKVKELAESYKPAMTGFLRDMIRLPSESCREKAVIERIREEMKKVGFDRVDIDPMGNVIGYVGTGKHLIAIDAHIDTVGVGNRDNWKFDPYEGFEDDEIIVGRGASDQEGGMASMVYAGKIIKEMGLEGDYTLMMVGTVQEEDCDGLCWQYIIGESGIRPEFVVSTEPTDGGIYRGQRGRMEIKVKVSGRSAHGSAPERGDNAIFKMGHILGELENLHGRLKTDAFLGKGSLAVSEIFFTSPSRCAVADSCSISVDRRLTAGEDRELAIREIEDLPAVKAANAEVTLYSYDRPSYTGLVYPTDCYFPSWVVPEDHVVIRSAKETFRSLFNQPTQGRQVDFFDQRRLDHGYVRCPVFRFRSGQGVRSPCARRKDLEGRSRALRRFLRCVASHIPGEKRGVGCEGHAGQWAMNDKLIFVAIGGNSLIRGKRLTTVEDQHRAVRQTVRHFADLIARGYQLVISHGNGPQVGFIMLRSEVAHRVTGLHLVPLPNVVADTQGSIGYQIQQSLNNELAMRGVRAIASPSSPRWWSTGTTRASQGRRSRWAGFTTTNTWKAFGVTTRIGHWSTSPDVVFAGWSHHPSRVRWWKNRWLRRFCESGYHVVTVGGGGIPVIRTNHGLQGVDAVIDKDLASSLLANQLDIGLFIISTEVEQVALNFGKPNQQGIDSMTVREAEQYVREGHFAPGSMLPKIEAALRFLRGGGRRVVITAPEFLEDAVLNGRGTHIVP